MSCKDLKIITYICKYLPVILYQNLMTISDSLIPNHRVLKMASRETIPSSDECSPLLGVFCLWSSYIPRRPQNFAKSSPYFWLQCTQSKVRGRFRKILWPSQNIWTLKSYVVILNTWIITAIITFTEKTGNCCC